MACKNISSKVLKISLWIILTVLAISIVVIVLFPTIFNAVLKKELALEKGTLATGIWEDIPIPLYEKVYLFNITNKEEFLDGKESLNVTEVGPYTYKSRWVKYPEWHPADYTVSYREVRTYDFVLELSVGPEEDEFYTLNGPMIIASSLATDEFDVEIRDLLSVLLGIYGETFVIKRSVKELIYGGYQDIIIKIAPLFKPDIPFKNGIFSWLYGKNDTDDGLFTIYTGSDDQTKTGMIKKWNDEEKLNFWKGDSCNQINGTSIEVGPPISGHQETYSFFQSIFCRSLTLNYTEDVSHFDISAKRFRPTYSLFANATENPDNYCFEMHKEQPSGLLDVSPCQFNASVYISFPHYYLGDPSLFDKVNGLNASEEAHGSFLDVEPMTGFTVNTFVRFQLNVEITKVEGILQTYNVTKGIFPILWVELSLELDEKFANFLKTKTRTSKVIAYSVLGILSFISLALSIVFIVILCLRKTSEDDDEPLLDTVDEDNDDIAKSKKESKDSHYGSVNKVDESENWKKSSDYQVNGHSEFDVAKLEK